MAKRNGSYLKTFHVCAWVYVWTWHEYEGYVSKNGARKGKEEEIWIKVIPPLTSGTKDEEFPSELQAIVIVVENGWCGGEELRHVSEELRCHDLRLLLGAANRDRERRQQMMHNERTPGIPGPTTAGSCFRHFLSNLANTTPPSSPSSTFDHVSRGTHPRPATANPSLSCLCAVSWRAQRLQGMCYMKKKTPHDRALSPHSLSVCDLLAHAFQLRGLESRLWRQSRHLPSFRIFRAIHRLLLPDVCQRFGCYHPPVGLTFATLQ